MRWWRSSSGWMSVRGPVPIENSMLWDRLLVFPSGSQTRKNWRNITREYVKKKWTKKCMQPWRKCVIENCFIGRSNRREIVRDFSKTDGRWGEKKFKQFAGKTGQRSLDFDRDDCERFLQCNFEFSQWVIFLDQFSSKLFFVRSRIFCLEFSAAFPAGILHPPFYGNGLE